MESAPVLRMARVRHAYPGRGLFRELDLTVAAGESVAVTGPSGSGKSTLLSCALGLVAPREGRVEVAGLDLRTLRAKALARHRAAHIGMVFQAGELLPELSPADNVALPALLAGVGAKDAYRRARALLRRFGVPDGSEGSATLSGGERQRTAVARAMINEPGLLLADEPTGALDEAARETVADALFALPRQAGCGLLLVTHDPVVAHRADRVLVLREGRLHEVPGVTGRPVGGPGVDGPGRARGWA
ncbi:ABC transporter ATP-binding protein (plasmid) [Streptomyces sp. BI20]|uniref:ABC transporter ATP-binding protein n=1 Tax=Streptomyces sp. BI20 TaxID=3403460 RepID=UPI003C720A35